MKRVATSRSRGVLATLARHQVIVCCGSGGVGKTTVSAALGIGIASAERKRVLVLTIDPARRLATALGLRSLGTRPVGISGSRLRRAGVDTRGEVAAAMLDMKSEWDRLVERHAPSAAVRDRVLNSPFYKGISDAFVGAHEYMALEALYNFHAGGEYDCIVVDTPPSRSALDFLQAPDRLVDFVGARLLGLLAGPSRIGWKAIDLASAPFVRVADRLLGTEMLADLAAFIRDFRGLYEGVRGRAADIYRLLRSDQTAFAVITTMEEESLAEARFFSSRLREYSMPLRAVVVNRVLPAALRNARALHAATTLAEDPDIADWFSSQLDGTVRPDSPRRLGLAFLALHEMAERQASLESRLEGLPGVPIARLPLARTEIGNLDMLGELARALQGA